MDDAKRSILKLLQEGRITAQEAERLLDELENSRKSTVSDKLKDIGSNLEEMAEDLNERFEELNKQYGPKVKSAVEDAGKKTVDLLNDLSSEIKGWFK